MRNSGKKLEGYIKVIEEILSGNEYSITPNKCVFNKAGKQIAEFDIEIKGKIGRTDFRWLIECRDRPSKGPAPGEWIEQLVGRKNRFDFDKVIAVSTTGFAIGAIEYAKDKGIDLRTVKKLTPESFLSWFSATELTVTNAIFNLQGVDIGINPNVSAEARKEINQKIVEISSSPNLPILVSTKTKSKSTLNQACKIAWNTILKKHPEIYEEDNEKIPKKTKSLICDYPNSKDRYQILISLGFVDILKITFYGEVSLITENIPIGEVQEYSKIHDNKIISQSINFKFQVNNEKRKLEIHRIPQDDHALIAIKTNKIKENNT